MDPWVQGSIWSDDRVGGDRLLLIRDAEDLAGRAVVIRSTATGRVALARAQESMAGYDARVHPGLAQRLVSTESKFSAEWRRAHWYDVLRFGDRAAFLTIVVAAAVAVVGAVIAFVNNKAKLGGLATLALVVALLLAVLKAREEWRKLFP